MSDTAERTHRIGCPLCEASCGLTVRTRGPEILEIRGDQTDALSRGHICPKGVALQDIHNDPRWLKRPVKRVGDGWVEVEWDEAIRLVAEGLVGVQREHGKDALAVYLGNPNVHSLGAMTHGLHIVRTLRTKNTYSATSVDQLPHQMAAWALYGHQFLIPVPDIDRTDLLVLFGHNPMASNGSIWTVPDFPGRVRELRARGGRLVVVDPRRTETARIADEHHPIRPGTDAAVLLAMLNVVLEEGLARPAAYVDGMEEVRALVADFPPVVASEISGMPASAIRSLAVAVASGRAAVHGRMGLSTQEFGLVCQWAIHALHALTGNLDRPGGVMFTDPAVDVVGRGIVGKGHHGAWRSRVRDLPEFGGELPVSTLADEMLTPGPGQVRGLLTIAGNPVSSTPGGARLAEAMDGLDFCAAIDPYLGPSTEKADIVLPPSGPLTRDHYDLIFHMFAVRNTARFSPAVFPRSPDARHDWEIARDLVLAIHRARGTRPPVQLALGLRTPPRRLLDVMLRTTVSRRLSVKRLAESPGGLDAGPLRPCLPERLFTGDKRVRLVPEVVRGDLGRVGARLLGEGVLARADRDHLLLIGRRHQRDNNSWMGRYDRLTRGKPRHALLIHPDDAALRGIRTGTDVTVTSAAGTVRVECVVTDDVMTGVVCLPHGYGHGRPGVSLNDLTDPAQLDEASGNAVLNGVPVTVEPV